MFIAMNRFQVKIGSEAAFEAWTKSEEFRRAHARADNKTGESLYLGHPKFEGFDVILSERKSSAAA